MKSIRTNPANHAAEGDERGQGVTVAATKRMAATGFRAGQLVEWLYVQRGGYGYGHWVPAVVRTGGEYAPDDWVTIDAQRADGTWRKRRVKAKNLRDAEFGGTE